MTQQAPATVLRQCPAGRLNVEYLPLEAVSPHARNPRRHSKGQIRQIARSIKTFGFNVPLLVDVDGTVIAGHGRLLAAQELGWTEVPTIRLEHLNEAQKRAFMIADNRLTEISAWDETILAEQFQELSLRDLDFSLETTGFEIGEIDLLIEGLAERPPDKADPADDLPAQGDNPFGPRRAHPRTVAAAPYRPGWCPSPNARSQTAWRLP